MSARDELLDALRRAERRLHGAWQMLAAINDGDPSRDRKAAAERAAEGWSEVCAAIQKATAGENE